MPAPHSDLYSAWYDAGDPATVTVTPFNGVNYVTGWADKSGNGRDAAAPLNADRPVFSAADGGGLVCAAANNANLPVSVPTRYAFAAVTWADWRLLGSVFGTSPIGAVLRLNQTGDPYYRAVGSPEGVNSDDYVFPGGRTWIDGQPGYTFAFGSPHVVTVERAANTTINRLGTASSGRPMSGVLREFVFVDVPLTDAQIAEISDYLVTRWVSGSRGLAAAALSHGLYCGSRA